MTQHQHELTSFLITLRQLQNLQNQLSNTDINYFPYVYSHLDNLFTLMFMLQFLEYGEDMNSQVFAELPTSTNSSFWHFSSGRNITCRAAFRWQCKIYDYPSAYSISPFIFVLSGLRYRVLNQINLFFGCFCLPKTWQRHISWRMTELRSRDLYAFRFKQWRSSGTCDTTRIFDNKGQ